MPAAIGAEETRSSGPVSVLEALSQLTRQTAEQPDFEHLSEVLVLTLCDQFAAPNAFIAVRNPVAAGDAPISFATGSYRGDETIAALGRMAVHDTFFVRHPEPKRVDSFRLDETQPNTVYKLASCGVNLVAPLLHQQRLIGLIGMGSRADNRPFAQGDIDLLSTIVHSVTPLIASSYLLVELSVLNAWYLDILDNVRQSVFVFDSNYQVRKVNRAGYRILARFQPETVGTGAIAGMPIHHVFTEDVFPGWVRRLVRAGSERQGTLIENLVAKGTKAEAIYNVRVSSIRRESGVKSDIIVTLDDVTAQKESEQRLFDLEKFAEKGVMASSIAHELNNFLGLILGGIELTQVAMQRSDGEKVQSALERLKEHVTQMQRFTSGLMDYTRLEMRKASGSLNALIGDVLSFVTVQKKFKRVAIDTELAPELPDFAFDRDQMAQLLLNLLNNAADAIGEKTEDGGRIVVGTGIGEGWVELSVGDDGIGMTEEVREKLFKSRLTTKEGGHGYGLITCSQIVENHGASVGIDSEIGKGSVFHFRFPLS